MIVAGFRVSPLGSSFQRSVLVELAGDPLFLWVGFVFHFLEQACYLHFSWRWRHEIRLPTTISSSFASPLRAVEWPRWVVGCFASFLLPCLQIRVAFTSIDRSCELWALVRCCVTSLTLLGSILSRSSFDFSAPEGFVNATIQEKEWIDHRFDSFLIPPMLIESKYWVDLGLGPILE